MDGVDPTGRQFLAGCAIGALINLDTNAIAGRKQSAGGMFRSAAAGCAMGAVGGEFFEARELAVAEEEVATLVPSEVALADTAESVAPGTKVYRVWGDASGPWGRFWTPINPASVADYADAAGLPAENTGRFVCEGVISNADNSLVQGSVANRYQRRRTRGIRYSES